MSAHLRLVPPAAQAVARAEQQHELDQADTDWAIAQARRAARFVPPYLPFAPLDPMQALYAARQLQALRDQRNGGR